MAEGIDTNTGPLWWLQPSNWTETSQNLVPAMLDRVSKAQQQKRDNVMKMLEFNLREKEANVRMQGELMHNKMTHDFMEDVPKINMWTMQLAQDPNAPPPTNLTSPKSLELVDQIRLRQSQSIVIKDSTKAFSDRIKALNTISPELAGQFAPFVGRVPTPEILDRLSSAEITARSQQQAVLETPLQPGEQRTVKIGGILYRATAEKALPEIQLDLEQQKIDLRKQEMDLRKNQQTLEADRIAEQRVRLEDIGKDFIVKSLQKQIEEYNRTLLSQRAKGVKEKNLAPFQSELESLQQRLRNRISALQQKEQPTVPEDDVKEFNYIPGQGLQPVK